MNERVRKTTKKEKQPAKRTKVKTKERKVEFSFYAPHAKEVFLAGEFNNWNAHSLPMKQNKPGMWQLKITLSPGRYEYKMCVDGYWVHDVPGAELVANPFGTHNCVIYVE
jgi:1,4-alpha-glucan branching enzyme